jgi:hypothetical protein
MQLERLSPEEITRAVAKIRKRYEEYIYKYFKPKTVLYAFEERYAEVLRKRMDISTFLLAEIDAVEELIRREEARVASGGEAPARKESVSARIDRVVEESLERIRRYPELAFHPTANEEIRRLAGALNRLQLEFWPRLTRLLHDTAYAHGSPTMVNLESRLRYLADRGLDGVPGALSRCLYQLNRFPRDYAAIDREEKDYILESAFFLHDLKDMLDRVERDYPRLEGRSKNQLREVEQYVQQVIGDFRVKELRRKQ